MLSVLKCKTYLNFKYLFKVKSSLEISKSIEVAKGLWYFVD